jgi:rod shape-determining protein MreD
MFVVLLLVQVLVLNHIHLYQVAMPLPYIFFVITFQQNTPRWLMLTSSFLLGLLLDIFTNTPGLAAGSLTLMAMVQPYLLDRMVPRDVADILPISSATLGFGKFFTFSAITTSVYCLIFYALEAFSFFDWQLWLLRTLCSSVLTLLLIVSVEKIRS